MAHFYEYLEFSNDEDRENQLEVYVEVTLEPETEDKLKALSVQGDWLVMAEPHCPDCVEIVAYFQRMAKLNPNIKVEYIACKEVQQATQFKHDEQLQAVVSEPKIPTIFDVSGNKAEIVLSEFPQFLKDKIDAKPEKVDEFIANFRMGKFGKEVEQELLAVLTKVK
ncbi:MULTISPECIES: thioredoxin family protein [unclassified Mannheimia]|uniref:thioredoxin family protein n=1 Tax=unclassified Mannheimia TaxID=2645054 RepID=UPI00359D3111